MANEELRRAMKTGHVPLVHALLGKKISNPNVKFQNGVSPLSFAVHIQNLELKQQMMDLLIRIKQPEEGMDFMKFTEQLKQDAGEMDIDAVYTSLLKSPVLGSMNNQEECFKEETRLVKDEVMTLIKRFSEHFGRRYPTFAFNPKLRGSMAENTKCGPPDEFDVILIMMNLSDHSQIDSINECKANMSSVFSFRRCIDIEQLMQLPPHEMIDQLHNLIENAPNYNYNLNQLYPHELIELIRYPLKRYLMEESTWQGSHLKFVSCDCSNVGVCLKLVFSGVLYKLLDISVDLVPCISLKIPAPVKVSIDWPVPLDFSKCQLYGLLRTPYEGFDLSSTDYEEVLLKSLPTVAIEAYVLGKAFGASHFEWRGPSMTRLLGKSYKMKKALLIFFQQCDNAQKVSRYEWLEGIVSVASNLEEYVKENECLRCIFHAENWTRGKSDCLNMSF
ncbi:hypothetical protein CAPTEDRAFT_186283 [Capitella teleta]|uniref:Mab-21-like nucleotidyltransferase domain-containing protein n=1 Tax=Capitella teleta TaxID=283909 RepID=R7V905_CAPTE|nr:hypothetical protein CAPTEDRAFT_186283 [Capitella teleta]|eukprot:ELU14997.1 hypothetical protein CAPTEDRAFT_186283 [Capitella teleta]